MRAIKPEKSQFKGAIKQKKHVSVKVRNTSVKAKHSKTGLSRKNVKTKTKGTLYQHKTRVSKKAVVDTIRLSNQATKTVNLNTFEDAVVAKKGIGATTIKEVKIKSRNVKFAGKIEKTNHLIAASKKGFARNQVDLSAKKNARVGTGVKVVDFAALRSLVLVRNGLRFANSLEKHSTSSADENEKSQTNLNTTKNLSDAGVRGYRREVRPKAKRVADGLQKSYKENKAMRKTGDHQALTQDSSKKLTKKQLKRDHRYQHAGIKDTRRGHQTKITGKKAGKIKTQTTPKRLQKNTKIISHVSGKKTSITRKVKITRLVRTTTATKRNAITSAIMKQVLRMIKQVTIAIVSKLLFPLIALVLMILLVVGVLVAVFGSAEAPTSDGLSPDVLIWEDEVSYWAERYEIEDWLWIILAMMEVETRGLVPDLMQSSESAGLPPNTLEYEESIEQGVRYLASIIAQAESLGNGEDTMGIIQTYNFGFAYISWLWNYGHTHNIDVSAYYSRTIVAPSLGNHDGRRFDYRNRVSIANGKTWIYANGGNLHYAYLVADALSASGAGQIVDDVALPLNPPFRVTCDFYCYDGHGGIDLSAYFGASVFAVKDGTVIRTVNHHASNGGFLGHPGGWGNMVMIDHHNGVVTVYAHLTNDVRVRQGQPVRAGQMIGREGNSGNSSGHHLHFEWVENGIRINPELRMNLR